MPLEIKKNTVKKIRIILPVILFSFFIAAYLGFIRQKDQQDSSNLKSLKINSHYHQILKLDEVLTQSSKLYTLTRDKKYQDRYNNHVPLLDHEIEQLLLLANDQHKKEFILMTKESNQKLISMEERSMKSGQYSILNSSNYEDEKKTYLKGMKELFLMIQKESQLKSQEKNKQNQIFLLIFLTLFVLSTLVVFFVLDQIQKRNVILSQLKRESEEALKAKSTFLATMSHEIRTPMNAVLSCSNLLLDNAKDKEDIKLLNTIHNSGNSLLTLINDILDFSKIESGKIDLENEPFDLHYHLKEVIDLLCSNASEKGKMIHHELNNELPQWINGDVTRFRQVMINLIGNATKFTKDTVEIKTFTERLQNGHFKIQFSISDNGIGISREAQTKLFQNFTQADSSTTRKYGGSGLGLAISKGIVTAMDGEIWVESEINRGSTFSFTMTVAQAQAIKSKTKTKLSDLNPKMAEQYPLRILLAEDNSVNQMVTKKVLAKLGYSIDVVSNGVNAVQAIKDKEYDIVLMDQHMPQMDGIDATREIRQFSQTTPKIFAFTASAFKEDKERCIEAGMDGFLTKPIEIDQVIEAFQKCHYESLHKKPA